MSSRDAEDRKTGFLDFLNSSVPRVEPPPFFASRVAAIAVEPPVDFVPALLRLTRHFVPIFLCASIVLVFLAYRSAPPAELAIPDSELLLEEQAQSDLITLEDVAFTLAPLSQNGGPR